MFSIFCRSENNSIVRAGFSRGNTLRRNKNPPGTENATHATLAVIKEHPVSISSVSNAGAYSQWQAMQRLRTSATDTTATNNGASSSGAAPAGPLSSATAGGQTPYDSIMVTLPNGFSFGVAHFGSSVDQATEDQMVKSVEQLAGALQGYSGVGSGTTVANGAAPAADPTSSQGTDATQGAVSTDMIDLDLPNGVSIEVQHSATGSETSDESSAVADQMVKAAEELAAALKAYSGTSSGAATPNNTSTTQSIGANGRIA
jgi:hypothetical protein